MAIIKSRQILHSKHGLKFGTDKSFLLRRGLQQSENQIPSWILDIREAIKIVLDTSDYRFSCIPFSSFDATRCVRIKGTGSESNRCIKCDVP